MMTFADLARAFSQCARVHLARICQFTAPRSFPGLCALLVFLCLISCPNVLCLPLFHFGPTTSSYLPTQVQRHDRSYNVELFYENTYYRCKKTSSTADFLQQLFNDDFAGHTSGPPRHLCFSEFHMFYMQLNQGTSGKSIIGLQPQYVVMRNYTTDLVLYKNRITTIPPYYFCRLGNISTLVIRGNIIQSSESFGFNHNQSVTRSVFYLHLQNSCSLALEELQLPDNRLETLVASSFLSFPNIKRLDLSGNDISAVHKDAFLGLRKLEELHLSDNKLETLPEDLFIVPRGLLRLDLSKNLLNETVFRSLNPLSELQVLSMNNNKFKSLRGEHFDGLVSLTELNLEFNNNIGNMTTPFGKMTNLVSLNLRYTARSNIPESLFGSLVNLTYLNLQNNNIKLVSNAHFRKNQKLATLDLTTNSLTAVPDLTSLKRLKKLVLTSNKITEITSADGFRICGMSNLEELDLARNKMTNIFKGAFDCNSSMLTLDLSDNSLRSIDRVFANAKIQKLRISENVIESFSFQGVSDHVVELDLSHNNLTKLVSHGDANLTGMALSRLYLENNRIAKLTDLYLPPNLRYLALDNNTITFFSLSSPRNGEDYSPATNLETVSLRNNRIKSVCPLILYMIDSKTSLDLELEGNPLMCTCESYFLKNKGRPLPDPNVAELSESGRCPVLGNDSINLLLSGISKNNGFSCEASSTDDLCQCNWGSNYANECNLLCPHPCRCFLASNFRSFLINCSGNELRYIPQTVSKLPLTLLFSNNRLVSINASMLASYSRSTELYLDSNELRTVDAGTFGGMEHLAILSLEFNSLEGLPNGVFNPLRKLKELYLAHNQLLKMSSRVFDPLRSIRLLRLHNNSLQKFPVWELNVTSTLNQLSLRGNPWSCDCDYVEKYRNWLQNYSYLVEDVSQLFCTAVNGSVVSSPLISFNSSLCYVRKDEVVVTNVAIWLSILASLVLVTLLVLMMFIYRQEMQVLIYSNYGLRLFHKGVDELDAGMVYDAFIAHSALDEEFLAVQLIPGLEQAERPYRVCIHQRDFLVGAVITESILEAVEKSRRTIVVLSKNFVRSEWCRFEFKSAHLKTLTDRCNRLIVIVLGQLPDDLDPEMKLYMKTNTYLEWGDRLFWEKLYFALPDRTLPPRN